MQMSRAYYQQPINEDFMH